jgi:hypothetical protein
VFPKAKWFNFPKTNQILTFYQTLLALHSIIVPFTKELLSFNNNEFCQSLLDFFEHIAFHFYLQNCFKTKELLFTSNFTTKIVVTFNIHGMFQL